MPNQLAISGAQPDKPTKFAPLYTGRYFSGIWTNRSPLRDAGSTRLEEKFYGARGDAAIAGSNVEITNRSTLIRRPGNQIYDNTNTYTNILAFDQFRINKSLNDVFGSTTEQIDVMVDTAAALHANVAGVDQTVFTKSNTGQAFMKQVGNSLYFGDGADNKKWLQSLFTRSSANNNTAIPTNSYPFMNTFLIDTNSNIQQMIGISVTSVTGSGNITNISLSSAGVVTVTLSAGLTLGGDTLPVGTEFLLWNVQNGTWLNGAVLTLTTAYTSGTSMVFSWTGTHAAASVSGANGDGTHPYLQAGAGFITAGATIATPLTGGTPTWGTTLPSSANNFMGSITLDGNVLWQARSQSAASSVYNWGIAAPTTTLTPTASGSSVAWAKSTYYSPACVVVDNVTGALWQVTTAGITGASQPIWTNTPSAATFLQVTNVSIAAGVATFTCANSLGAGQTLKLGYFRGTTAALNGQTVTVLSTGLSGTQFEANVTGLTSFTSIGGANWGQAVITSGTGAGSTQADNTVTWTCIQSAASLTWSQHFKYFEGQFIVQNVGSTPNIFQITKGIMPVLNGTITGYGNNSTTNGAYNKSNPLGAADFTLSNCPSLDWRNSTSGIGDSMKMYALNGAGEETGSTTDTGKTSNWEAAIVGTMYIPGPGTYSFTFCHDDGGFLGFDTSANANYRVSGPYNNPIGQTVTAKQGYASGNLVGSNQASANNSPPNSPWIDAFTWYFPEAGNYGYEIDFTVWHGTFQQMALISHGLAGSGTSGPANIPQAANGADETIGSNSTVWPAFTTTGASYDTVNQVINWGATVIERYTQQNLSSVFPGEVAAGNIYKWSNIGPSVDFTYNKSTTYTLPGTSVVDSAGNQQGAYESGVSGTTAPTFSETLNQITADNNPPLKWICEGPVGLQASGTGKITATSAQGWLYGIALVNTLDDTVSNIGPVSSGGAGTNGGTGPVTSGQITFAAGAGLNASTIDPQADYVAIFRTTDGGPNGTFLLIDNANNSFYTVPLTQYLQSGYIDTTPDTSLDSAVEAAAAGEQTPPLPGAVNLTYHLNRIWFSIGNTVYYTSGPVAPVGNGTDGVAPTNFDTMPSLVKRLVPWTQGVLVFTVSDVYIIPTVNGTIYPGIPFSAGLGLPSYNALDINGGIVGMFTTDSQFVIFDPNSGVAYVGFPIGDQLRQNNGSPGTSWTPANVYVTWYVSGEDQGWFVADGTNGWYRLIQILAPDPNPAWSPFASVVGGVKAIKAIETSPGVHQLLQGPTGSGVKILARNLTASTDGGTTGSNGTPYAAYAVLGSYVLAHPGQVAEVAFITTDIVNVGSPLTIGVLIDEALPYYNGAFQILKNWVNDPPGLAASASILGQRFYLSDMPDTAAVCRHMQVQIQWPAEAALNELQSFTIFGRYMQEV